MDRGTKLDHQLIGNVLFNFLGQFYALVLGFAVVPYVVHRIGPGLYGVLVMVATMGGFGAMLNLGMGNALTKYISEYQWNQDFDGIRSLFQAALAVCLLAGTVFFVLLVSLKGKLGTLLFHGEASAELVVDLALWIAGCGFLLSAVTEAFSAVPLGLQRFDIYNRISILTSTVRNLGMVLVLALGWHVKAVLLAYFFSGLLSLLGYAYYARRLIVGLRLRPRFVWSDVKQLVRYSAWVLLAGLTSLVVHRVDRVLVAYYLPISAVAFYAVPSMLAEKTATGVGNVTSVIFPSTSELSAMKAAERLRELYVRATKVVILAGLPVTAILLALPSQVLRWWVGPDFAARGALPLQLLAAGFMFNILGHVPFVVSQGIGRPAVSARYSLLNALINLAFFLVLIPRYGIAGAAGGFLLSEALVMPAFIWETNRVLSVSWFSLISRAYLRPFACGLTAFGILCALKPYTNSLPRLIACCAVGGVIYALLAFVAAIDTRERVGIYEQAVSVLHLVRGAVDV